MNIYDARVGKQFDRRRKLTDEQREEIKRLYSTGNYSQQRLAIKFGVGHDTIHRIVNPDAERRRKGYSVKHGWKYRPTPEKNKRAISRHLQYKQILIDYGKIEAM